MTANDAVDVAHSPASSSENPFGELDRLCVLGNSNSLLLAHMVGHRL